jgi:hypothetical protein
VQIPLTDLRPLAPNGDVLHKPLQLEVVPRQRQALDMRQGFWRELQGTPIATKPGMLGREVLDEQWNVFSPLAKRRNANLECTQSLVEPLALGANEN